jgi:hypothetical protein
MMTDAEKRDYERAAVALEKDEILANYPRDEWMNTYGMAWQICNRQEPGTASIRDIDNRAASLLRECIATGKELPR